MPVFSYNISATPDQGSALGLRWGLPPNLPKPSL